MHTRTHAQPYTHTHTGFLFLFLFFFLKKKRKKRNSPDEMKTLRPVYKREKFERGSVFHFMLLSSSMSSSSCRPAREQAMKASEAATSSSPWSASRRLMRWLKSPTTVPEHRKCVCWT